MHRRQHQIVLIEQRISTLGETARSIRAKTRAYNAQQRKKLATARELSEELRRSLTKRLESYQSLRADSLSTEDEVVDARRRVIENKLGLAELEVSMHEVDLREIQTEESYLSQMDQIADLSVQLEELILKEALIQRRLLEASLSNRSQVREIERSISRLRSQVQTMGRIVSDSGGRILEVTVSAGSFVEAGQRIGTMEAEDPASSLMALAYFRIRDGKKIRPGMRVRVSPSTVQPGRYGSILGVVSAVSDYPVTTEAAANQVGNREIARALTDDGHQIETLARLEIDAGTFSGYAWTSTGGPPLRITAGTTAAVRVTIEELSPISFVIPLLRRWTGTD